MQLGSNLQKEHSRPKFMTKSAHVEEIFKHRESWLQAIWAHQLFSQQRLVTTTGEAIEVLFAGWLNKGAGPDFHEARVVIGDAEYQGAVEVHLRSAGWYAHKHHENPLYNSVVLHVVLDQKTSRHIEREDGRRVPELELRPRLKENVVSLLGEEKQLLDHYDHLPGHCGLMVNQWGAKPLKRLLGHAAEARMQEKVQKIFDQWTLHKPEQLLFQSIFKTLGYSAYSYVFEELAQLFPLAVLHSFLQQPYRTARILILARWFGACGLLPEEPPPFFHATLRKEFFQWQAEWNQQSPVFVAKKFAQPSRPQNAPERRLVGMFHHLYHLNTEGLLKGWLKVLKHLEAIVEEKTLKKEVLQKTQALFATPDWEAWQHYLGLPAVDRPQSAQLIGKDRQIIIWANAIIPFFLAYARQEKWVALEKLLYRLFLALPPEAANSRTRFMEKRLSPFPRKELRPKTLHLQQGLIQIHQDFCQSFERGCEQCRLVGFLEKFHKDSPKI